MGEFDLSLIREFRDRPAFYDRNCPKFKDKVYTAHEWQEISNKLGFDVSLLKDRMLQLRNRYNLEKRRIEQLREENPGKNYESPWPLFEHLQFLSDHIRARRSYKRMMPMHQQQALRQSQAQADLSNSCSNGSMGAAGLEGGGGDDDNDHDVNGDDDEDDDAEQTVSITMEQRNLSQPMVTFPNGLLTVKVEEEDDMVEGQESDAETEGRRSGVAEAETFAPPGTLETDPLQPHSAKPHRRENFAKKVGRPAGISIRRLDTLRDQVKLPRKRQLNATVPRSLHSATNTPHSSSASVEDAAVLAKRQCTSVREIKYAAFGNFIASSLLDLPQSTALQLVEKFTSELVKVLIEKTESATPPANDLENTGQ